MLKIVYPICCGMDVHKSFVYACIASTNEQGVTTYKSKRFSTFTKDLRFCAEWLAANNCKDVCMESTGKYWIPVYNILEPTCNVVLAHPKYVKAIKGKKTDKKDAKWIADIFKHDLVSGSFIPPADIRQLRDLVRYRWKLTNFVVGEKNRAQNCLTVSNIKLDDVFSDVFGKASSNIISRMLENPSVRITDVTDFRTKGMKATDEEVLAAVDGEFCPEQAEKLRIIRFHMDNLELCKLNVESLILTVAEKYTPQINLVSTVPVSKHLPPSESFPRSARICPCSQPPSISARGLVLLRRTMRVPERRKPLASVALETTSSPYLFNVLWRQLNLRKIPKSAIDIYLLKSAEVTRRQLLLSPECCSLPFTTFSKRMNLTMQTFILGRTIHPHIALFR